MKRIPMLSLQQIKSFLILYLAIKPDFGSNKIMNASTQVSRLVYTRRFHLWLDLYVLEFDQTMSAPYSFKPLDLEGPLIPNFVLGKCAVVLSQTHISRCRGLLSHLVNLPRYQNRKCVEQAISTKTASPLAEFGLDCT